MGTSGCLEINGTVVTKCRDEDIPAGGHVKIPAGVTKIEGCNLYNSIMNLFDPAGVAKTEERGFRFCGSLTSVSIPASVTEIDEGAFYRCTGLTSVAIPEGVTKIGNNTFSGCTSLASVVIPDGVRSIGDWAFSNCTSLASVTVPKGVTEIGFQAFAGCTGLASVTIPASVRHIGKDAFANCPLKEVHYGGGKDAWLAITGDRPMVNGMIVNLYPKGLPGNSADRQAAQPGTAKPTMKCPSCETEWTPGKSANRPTACPFCGASLS